MKKSIDFLITQNCNYRCPYCSQSKKFVKGDLENASDSVLEAFLSFLDRIDKSFEITISGGEPLCHPKFFDFAEKIVKKGFNISVVSNFSYPISWYEKLKTIAGNQLAELFVSCHIGQVKNIDEFLEKTSAFDSIKENTKFTVGAVLSDDNLTEIKKIALFLKQKNINFELQHMRIKNSYVEYKKDAKEFISNFPVSKIKSISNTYAKLCHAGCSFAFIYQNGDAYRCYSSRFNKVHKLGNIQNKNFKLYKAPIPCLNKNCTCPKPIINGMVETAKSAPLKAIFLSFYNALFIPYLVCKNSDIVCAKIKQWIKFKK